MQPADLIQFNQAVEQLNSGTKAEAYRQIKQLSSKYPDDPNVLLWLAFTSPDLKESEDAIQRISLLDPSNQNLNAARTWLQNEKAKSAPKAPLPPSFEVNPPVAPPPLPPVYKQPGVPRHPSNPYQSGPLYNSPPDSFPSNRMPPPAANFYYPTSGYMPQRVLSGGAVFGYFLLYFFGCLAMVLVVVFLASLLEPSSYSYYYGYYKSGNWAFPAALLLVVITSIWAASDASQRRARFGPAVKDTGFSTFLGCILVWIIIFPLYLARRRKNIAYFGS
jgi:hypothetical protein